MAKDKYNLHNTSYIAHEIAGDGCYVATLQRIYKEQTSGRTYQKAQQQQIEAGQGTGGQGRAGQGRAGHAQSRAGQSRQHYKQGRAGQGRQISGQGRAGQGRNNQRQGSTYQRVHMASVHPDGHHYSAPASYLVANSA